MGWVRWRRFQGRCASQIRSMAFASSGASSFNGTAATPPIGLRAGHRPAMRVPRQKGKQLAMGRTCACACARADFRIGHGVRSRQHAQRYSRRFALRPPGRRGQDVPGPAPHIWFEAPKGDGSDVRTPRTPTPDPRGVRSFSVRTTPALCAQTRHVRAREGCARGKIVCGSGKVCGYPRASAMGADLGPAIPLKCGGRPAPCRGLCAHPSRSAENLPPRASLACMHMPGLCARSRGCAPRKVAHPSGVGVRGCAHIRPIPFCTPKLDVRNRPESRGGRFGVQALAVLSGRREQAGGPPRDRRSGRGTGTGRGGIVEGQGRERWGREEGGRGEKERTQGGHRRPAACLHTPRGVLPRASEGWEAPLGPEGLGRTSAGLGTAPRSLGHSGVPTAMVCGRGGVHGRVA